MSADPVSADTEPHVLIMLLESLPDDFAAATCADLDLPGLDARVVRHAGGPYAGVELYLPAAAALFIAAGFFNGFLNKAGEDAYGGLKRATKALWRRTQHLSVRVGGTPGKVAAAKRFSLAFSVTGQLVPGLNFKLVIRSDIAPGDAEAGIDAFLDLLDDLYNDRLSRADCEALLTYRPVGGTVLVTFDAEARRIVPVNAFAQPADAGPEENSD
jgi:hypothetical protein